MAADIGKVVILIIYIHNASKSCWSSFVCAGNDFGIVPTFIFRPKSYTYFDRIHFARAKAA